MSNVNTIYSYSYVYLHGRYLIVIIKYKDSLEISQTSAGIELFLVRRNINLITVNNINNNVVKIISRKNVLTLCDTIEII